MFEFYMALIDLLSSMNLGKFNLRKYSDLPQKVGNHYVSGHDRFTEREGNGVLALNESCINRIYAYCQKDGYKKLEDILMMSCGTIPYGLNPKELSNMVFFYDPENLPGFHEIANPVKITGKNTYEPTQRMKAPFVLIDIDGDMYYIPHSYIEPDDLSIIPGKSVDDL